jgi:hypothetical protein
LTPSTVSFRRRQPADTDAGWLDLCCGSGRALIQAAGHLRQAGRAEHVALVGVDLVDTFDPTPAPDPTRGTTQQQADTAADPSMITSIIRRSSRCDAGA